MSPKDGERIASTGLSLRAFVVCFLFATIPLSLVYAQGTTGSCASQSGYPLGLWSGSATISGEPCGGCVSAFIATSPTSALDGPTGQNGTLTFDAIAPGQPWDASGQFGSYTWTDQGSVSSDGCTINASWSDSLGQDGTVQYVYQGGGPTSCQAANVILSMGGKPSRDGFPTTMIAKFSPMAANGTATSLALAAAACQFVEFDWKQTIDYLPLIDCTTSPLQCPTNYGLSTLVAPPSIDDPPSGGWNYFLTNPAAYGDFFQAYPFYYNSTIVSTGCSIESSSGACVTPITSSDDKTLTFSDAPCDIGLVKGQNVGFTTHLVAVLPNNTVGPVLFSWSWLSTYNCVSGTIQYASDQPVNGEGTGGVTITSINGVPQGSVILFPSAINFGNVNLNTRKKEVLTLTNNSTAKVQIGAVSFTNISGNPADFTFHQYCNEPQGGELFPGNSCTIAVFFDADAVATDTATLNIVTNVPGSPLQVPITATGISKKRS